MAKSETQIRRELLAVMDELAAVPRDEFAARARLQRRKAELGQALRELDGPGADDTRRAWAERSTGKPSTEGTPYIPSPGEGGIGG